MKIKHLFLLSGLLLTSYPLINSMEAPPATIQNPAVQEKAVPSLKEQSMRRLVSAEAYFERAENILIPDLKERLKKHVILKNLLLFADLFKSVSSKTLKEHSEKVKSYAFNRHMLRALTGSEDGTLRIWNLQENPATLTILKGHTAAITGLAFSQDGRFALTCSDDRTARIWDLHQNPIMYKALDGYNDHGSRIAAFSPDGRHVLICQGVTRARLWDIHENPATSLELPGNTHCINRASFSPNGRYLITTALEDPDYLWDLQQNPLNPLFLETTGVLSADFRFDNAYALIGCRRHAILWNLQHNPPIQTTLTGHSSEVWKAIFSSDGKLALTCSFDQTARLWNLQQQKPTSVVLQGHTESVTTVAFSPDDRYALTGSHDDKSVRLWDLQQDPISSIVLYEGRVDKVGYNIDGTSAIIQVGDSLNCYDKEIHLCHLTEAKKLTLPQLQAIIALSKNPAIFYSNQALYKTIMSLPEIEKKRVLSYFNLEDDIQIHLIKACEKGNLVAAKALLALGYPVNKQDADGNTPLIVASHTGHSEIVMLLLDAKADIYIRNNKGNDALKIAGDKNITLLLNAKAGIARGLATGGFF